MCIHFRLKNINTVHRKNSSHIYAERIIQLLYRFKAWKTCFIFVKHFCRIGRITLWYSSQCSDKGRRKLRRGRIQIRNQLIFRRTDRLIDKRNETLASRKCHISLIARIGVISTHRLTCDAEFSPCGIRILFIHGKERLQRRFSRCRYIRKGTQPGIQICFQNLVRTFFPERLYRFHHGCKFIFEHLRLWIIFHRLSLLNLRFDCCNRIFQILRLRKALPDSAGPRTVRHIACNL